VALLFALCLLSAAAGTAHAGPYEDALARFLTDSFDDTIEGINGVAVSGNPLAEKVIAPCRPTACSQPEQKEGLFSRCRRRAVRCRDRIACCRKRRLAISPRYASNNRLRRIVDAAVGAHTAVV